MLKNLSPSRVLFMFLSLRGVRWLVLSGITGEHPNARGRLRPQPPGSGERLHLYWALTGAERNVHLAMVHLLERLDVGSALANELGR